MEISLNKSFIFSSFADLGIDVPDFLDLSRLRATGLQAGEEELPDLMPPIVLPEDTRGTEMNLYQEQLDLGAHTFTAVCTLYNSTSL